MKSFFVLTYHTSLDTCFIQPFNADRGLFQYGGISKALKFDSHGDAVEFMLNNNLLDQYDFLSVTQIFSK